MTNLRRLLATWENWSARDTLTRALTTATTEDSRRRTTRSLAEVPTVSALDALHAGTELVELLGGWQWQAMYAARVEGASWEQIGTALHTTAPEARDRYLRFLDRQELLLGCDVSTYREVLLED
jgi:hypothetical protein